MDFLRSAYEMLPRKWGSGAEQQAVLSTKTAVSALCAACSLQTGSGASELPYYGLSPPVYPSRKVFRLLRTPTSGLLFPDRRTNTAPKHPGMDPQMSGGHPPLPMPGAWSNR